MRERNQYTKQKMDKNSGRYLKPLRYPNIPLSTSDMYVNTVVGDRLDLMADQFYNDPRLWWLIAQANPDKLRTISEATKRYHRENISPKAVSQYIEGEINECRNSG